MSLKNRRTKATPPPAQTTTKKRSTPPPAAPAAAPAPRKLGRGRGVDPELLRAAAATAAAARGPKTPFLKRTGGRNVIRLLGPRDPEVSPLPWVEHRVHSWQEKFKMEALDLDFLFANKTLTELAIKLGRITQADFEKWQAYGRDPWNIAGDRAKAAGKTGKDSGAPYLFSSVKYAYNVINRADGEIYLFVTGRQDQDAILGFAGLLPVGEGEEPDEDATPVFDEENGHDLKMQGNGKDGKQRRYTTTVLPKPTPAVEGGEVDPEKMVNLEEYVARRAMGFDQKVLTLFRQYGSFVRSLGLSPSDFGLTADVAPATPSQGEEEEED